MRKDQVIFKKRAKHLKEVVRQVSTTDFPLRMRNQLAMDLGDGEEVVDDDFVGISRGQKLGKRAAGQSLPLFGVVIATNQRLRIATADDDRATDVALADIRLTHDEANAMTMLLKPQGASPEAVTLLFLRRKCPVAQFLRQATLDGGKAVKHGPATPRLSASDRLRSAFRR